jgi:hypothetical protein
METAVLQTPAICHAVVSYLQGREALLFGCSNIQLQQLISQNQSYWQHALSREFGQAASLVKDFHAVKSATDNSAASVGDTIKQYRICYEVRVHVHTRLLHACSLLVTADQFNASGQLLTMHVALHLPACR